MIIACLAFTKKVYIGTPPPHRARTVTPGFKCLGAGGVGAAVGLIPRWWSAFPSAFSSWDDVNTLQACAIAAENGIKTPEDCAKCRDAWKILRNVQPWNVPQIRENSGCNETVEACDPNNLNPPSKDGTEFIDNCLDCSV